MYIRVQNLFISFVVFFRYFWYTNALDASESIGDVGGFNWRVFLTLFAGWVIVYLCIFRGIKSSGKVQCTFFAKLLDYFMTGVVYNYYTEQ